MDLVSRVRFETAYLYACFTSERFRRLVDAKELVPESAEATKKKTELVANLSRGRAVMDEVCSDLQRLEARVELALENARMGRGTEIIATEIDMNRPFLEDNLSDFTLGAENTEPNGWRFAVCSWRLAVGRATPQCSIGHISRIDPIHSHRRLT